MTTTQSKPLWFAENTAPSSAWFCLDRIYLHGEIENIAGFDLLVNTTGVDALPGIYPVVVDVSGKTYGCTAYVWAPNVKRKFNEPEPNVGLVVLNTDKAANEHALKKFNDQATSI